MKSTRDRILSTLLAHPRISTNDIAKEVGINAISVRHHLTNLQMLNLIDSAEEMHGVGRPRLVYFLTEIGMEKFPTRYLRLTTRILSQMKSKLSKPMVTEMFREVAEIMAEEHAADLVGLGVEDRLNYIQELLADEGFVIEWEKKDTEYHIHEVSCPYLQIGQDHPEVCALDQTLISSMLALPVHKIQCVLSGANHCTYVVNNS
jgi:predicted ArsR family transcriptional regulator